MNILTLCTYPIKNPMHGGQLRVRNIVDLYVEAEHNVEVVGVLGSEGYEPEPGFLSFPGVDSLATAVGNPFLMEDFAIGELFSDRGSNYKRLASLIRSVPDVIHVEHPWLYKFAKNFIKNRAPLAKIIYSSHNIEWRLKKEILCSYFDCSHAKNYAEMIKAYELEAIAGSDAIICVSESDAQWVKAAGGKHVVVAPNGVKAWFSTEEGRNEAVNHSKGYRYTLYCASAHPPNMQGFFEIFGGGFGSLKPDEKLVVVGGAGWSIAGDVRVHQSAKLAEKVLVAGLVSQSCLEGLLDGAACIVLPLTQGGGTNLKTAEALWSGKHIVATSIAMRGFERFIGARGVHVVDDPSEFKRTLRMVMALEPLSLSAQEVNERQTVLWGNCLNSLLKLINNLAETNRK